MNGAERQRYGRIGKISDDYDLQRERRLGQKRGIEYAVNRRGGSIRDFASVENIMAQSLRFHASRLSKVAAPDAEKTE